MKAYHFTTSELYNMRPRLSFMRKWIRPFQQNDSLEWIILEISPFKMNRFARMNQAFQSYIRERGPCRTNLLTIMNQNFQSYEDHLGRTDSIEWIWFTSIRKSQYCGCLTLLVQQKSNINVTLKILLHYTINHWNK